MNISQETSINMNKNVLLETYRGVMAGDEYSPRGSKVREVLNAQLIIDPLYPVTSFESRNFNLSYAKEEVLWYLRGNRFDKSICDVSGTWQTLVQPDGGLNSNYGQVIFNGQRHFDWVIQELLRDRDSRRAVIILGDGEMLSKDNTDHRCTLYISYMIRENKLIQMVHMRSNDVVYGLTNDLFFFGLLQQMIYVCLLPHYPDLELGWYMHMANSMHAYEKHFYMLDNIISKEDWYTIDIPRISSSEEVDWLRYCQGKGKPKEQFAFANWLLSR